MSRLFRLLVSVATGVILAAPALAQVTTDIPEAVRAAVQAAPT